MMDNGEQGISFQDVISQYHQIDQAFNGILGSIVSAGSQVSGSGNFVENILNQLAQFFQVTVISDHPYYRFEESDVFLFFEPEGEVYLIYVEDEEGEEGE